MCVCVCIVLGQRWAVQNEWTDREVVFRETHVGSRNHVLHGGQDPPREGANLRVLQATEKHSESLLQCMKQKASLNPQLQHDSWLQCSQMVGVTLSLVKNPPPCDVALVKILWLVYNIITSLHHLQAVHRHGLLGWISQVAWSVCVSVCACVGHTSELCKN